MEPIAPSGRQLELGHGEQRVTIVEVGGGLRDYRVGDRPVLDGYDAAAMASRGRGQLLAPWPNRIAGGRYTFAGTDQQLPINEVALGNAIHGLTRWSAWDLQPAGPAGAKASCVLHPQSGYPFTVAFTADYQLGDDGLTVTMTATNRGREPAPVGLGAHPYLYIPGPDGASVPADDVRLTVPAATRLLSDDRSIPTGRQDVTDTPFDFRAGRLVGDLVIDSCFTDLIHDPGGRVTVSLAGPGDSPPTTVWVDRTWPFVQVFTGDTLSPGERRRSIAVEPLTCPANAFNSGDGLQVLDPGQTFGGSWGIRP